MESRIAIASEWSDRFPMHPNMAAMKHILLEAFQLNSQHHHRLSSGHRAELRRLHGILSLKTRVTSDSLLHSPAHDGRCLRMRLDVRLHRVVEGLRLDQRTSSRPEGGKPSRGESNMKLHMVFKIDPE